MARRKCEHTGKVRYGTKTAADKALINGANGIRSYFCTRCRSWHTTSLPIVSLPTREESGRG